MPEFSTWCLEWNCLLLTEFTHKLTRLLQMWRSRTQVTQNSMTPLTLTYNFGAPTENTPTVPSHGNTIMEILPIQLLDIDFNPSVRGLPPKGNTEWQGGQTEILHLQPDFKATSLIINMGIKRRTSLAGLSVDPYITDFNVSCPASLLFYITLN